MPTPIATTTKATARKHLSQRANDWWNPSTTSSGNAGGTTAVFSSLVGYGDDYFKDWWVLQTSGANAGEWRRVESFTDSSGTVTVVNAFTAQVASGVTFELHKFRPDHYTFALNEGSVQAYPAVCRPITGFALAGDRDWYPTPRNMRDIVRVLYDADAPQESDTFTRDDSTSTAGSDYTAASGDTFGISSNRLYSVSDADGDLLIADNVETADGVFSARVTGTLNSATDYRSPALVFRYLDASNYLVVRLLNSAVALRKVDGGSESSLTTAATTTANGTDYTLRVWAAGNWVRVFVDGVELINYELTGANTKYLDYEGAGFRLDKGGSPGTAARWDDYRVHKAGNLVPLSDFEQATDRRTFRVGALGPRPGLGTDHLLIIEGRALLAQVAEDTTYGTLATDSTAVLEIETSDPAWPLLMQFSLAVLYEMQAQPVAGGDAEDRALYTQQAQNERAKAERDRGKLAMPRPRTTLKFPQ